LIDFNAIVPMLWRTRSGRFSIGLAGDASPSFGQSAIHAIRGARGIRKTKRNAVPENLYTPALGDIICKRVSEGESLRAICRDHGMPSEGTVRGWAREDRDGFGSRYRLARELQLDHWADLIIDIADEEDRDPRDRQIRIETRKWVMSKLGPRRYGDRLLVAGEAENPLRVLHEQVSVERLSSEQLSTLEAFVTAMVQKQREPA
jgi:Bacteriophage Sf6, terminase small subunit-like